jgi:hypothetical protein
MTKSLQILPTRLAQSVMLMTGGLAVVLGLLVLVGWHTHNVHLLQMIPTFAPMQYNAALGLLLCGSGLLTAVGHLAYTARVRAQHYPHLLPRLIFLTGDTLNAETTRRLEQVGAPRLSKPFTAPEVRRVVQQALQTL